jgi:hypothetical protein
MTITYVNEGESWILVAKDEAIGYNQETICLKVRVGEQGKFTGKA